MTTHGQPATPEKMKFITVSLGVWKWEGLIAIGGTVAEFVAFAKANGATNISDTEHSAGRAYVEFGVPWMLWVESIADVPALAHEALHVAFWVLDCHGLKPTDASIEAYTYTQEAILRTALNATDWQEVDQ